MRERLMQLLGEAIEPYLDRIYPWDTFSDIVDYLLDNGVIVPPVKVGQTVWFVPLPNDSKGIIETWVGKVVAKVGGLYIKMAVNAQYETTCNSIGKTVFLTREAAEAALKAREQNERGI